jgi:hypothetical protein
MAILTQVNWGKPTRARISMQPVGGILPNLGVQA